MILYNKKCTIINLEVVVQFYCFLRLDDSLCFITCQVRKHLSLLCLFHAGFWKTSGCVIYCQTLQHEQKQSGQPVLQCGSGRLHLHSFKTLPEFKAHRLWSSGNSLVRYFLSNNSILCFYHWFLCSISCVSISFSSWLVSNCLVIYCYGG